MNPSYVENEAECGSESYEPEYEVETVTVGGRHELHVLCLLPPPLEYMSTLHSQQKEISGRQVWTGSLLLANLLCQEEYRGMFDNKRVLELGSGTGILGMTLAKVAMDCLVTLSDGDSLAVGLLEQNLANPDNQLDTSAIRATSLLWSTAIDQKHEFCGWCRRTWNWADSDKVGFHYILAGDVLYKDELPALFFATVRSLMLPNGVLYLCHVPRANVSHEVVANAAAIAGFVCEHILDLDATALVPDGCTAEDLSRARIYRLIM